MYHVTQRQPKNQSSEELGVKPSLNCLIGKSLKPQARWSSGTSVLASSASQLQVLLSGIRCMHIFCICTIVSEPQAVLSTVAGHIRGVQYEPDVSARLQGTNIYGGRNRQLSCAPWACPARPLS